MGAARAKLQRVLELRAEASSALAAALEVPVQQVDVAAVELAIGAAVEVGVDADEVSRARSNLEQISRARADEIGELARLMAMVPRQLDLKQLEVAIEVANAAGLHAASIASAAELKNEVERQSRPSPRPETRDPPSPSPSRHRPRSPLTHPHPRLRPDPTPARRSVSRRRRVATRTPRVLEYSRGVVRDRQRLRYRIGEITAELLMASRMLRAGNIFMKYSATAASRSVGG